MGQECQEPGEGTGQEARSIGQEGKSSGQEGRSSGQEGRRAAMTETGIGIVQGGQRWVQNYQQDDDISVQ